MISLKSHTNRKNFSRNKIDYLKTDNDRRREDLLLQDLVRLVNERDDIIQELDLHEKV